MMVIDNADDAQLFSQQGNLGQFVPECAHGSVLVTTRNKVAGSRLTQSGRLIEVGKMDKDESRQMLQGKLEADNPSPDDLSTLSSRLEHLPLALVQAAAFIQEMSMSVREYLRLLEKSDQDLVNLLSQEFETVGRDPEAARAVAETWILSFEQIQQQDTFAGELLSLMSLFDRQAIPRQFLHDYGERQQAQEPSGEMQLAKALGVLKAFSFITEDKDHGFDIHRLVQLVTRKWLGEKGVGQQFAEQALLVVSHNYPNGNHENRAICIAYLPHAYAVLRCEGIGSRDERLARATLLACAAGLFNYQASTYWNQGRWKEAEELLAKELSICSRVLGEEHPDTLISIANLASIYRNQGRWKEAEELGVQVIKTRKKVLGEEHPSTLNSMANLASTYRNQRRWKEAEELEIQVVEMRKRVLGEEHPSTLDNIANLVLTYGNQSRWKEAEKLGVQVIETRKKVLGEEHPSTLTSMGNLASTYGNQGRWKEAEKLEVQVMETRNRVLGKEHPDTLASINNLASTYQNQGRWKEAESLGVQVMETVQRVLGKEHPHTLTSMANLAFTWKSQDRLSDALELMRNCLHLRQRVLGQDHPDTASAFSALTNWLGQKDDGNC
ncbi:hypothetical protein B0T24DRAFT_73221 [Lasiosphaeria ovina]|uniref:DUF7779 domain-containing protein n=1 Tax=Lasiosphaeria ovina TaxID=92902 RepID=A0AAE0NM95_9PEZI|nr:hypothetical protein B0T24DRAFT_73221 [Lasiosphaeria ovina]